MHELSIALSIIEGAEEEAERQGGGRVCAVHLRLGPLSGVVRDALEFSYAAACQGTALEGSKLVIEEAPVRLACEHCGCEVEPVSPRQLHCSRCGETDCRVVNGDQLELAAMELET